VLNEAVWSSLLYDTYFCSKNSREWTKPYIPEAIASAMRRNGSSDKSIHTLLSLMRFREAPRSRIHRHLNCYGQMLASGKHVKVTIGGFVVHGTVVDSWKIAHIVRMEKNGEIRWIPGESDLSLD
jgi:hypothetical protein